MCVTFAAPVSLYRMGYRINRSNSLPQRVFRVAPLTPDYAVSVGDYVAVDLNAVRHSAIQAALERRYISPGVHMLKEIGAVGGDVVTISDDFVYINGVSTPIRVASEDGRGSRI